MINIKKLVQIFDSEVKIPGIMKYAVATQTRLKNRICESTVQSKKLTLMLIWFWSTTLNIYIDRKKHYVYFQKTEKKLGRVEDFLNCDGRFTG